MKSYILLIIAIVVSGCALTLPMVPADLDEICIWVHENIPYVEDETDNWQRPAVTMKRGGDCEDLTILFMALANEYLDIKPDLIIVDPGGGLLHAAAFHDGYVYDATAGWACPASWYQIIGGEILEYYTYGQVMYFAIVTGCDT